MYFNEEIVFVKEGRSNYRIPSVVADKHGVVYAFCNDRKDTDYDGAAEVHLVGARKKPGCDWEAVKTLDSVPDWAISMGAAVYDEEEDIVMCSGWRIPKQKDEFASYTEEELAENEKREKELGIYAGQFLLYSTDGGDTWQDRPLVIETVDFVHKTGELFKLGGYCHGSEHGVQLRHGEHKGRLLCPSRTQAGEYHSWEELTEYCYNNTIYSDDHGVTWKAGAPVQIGTGEGTLIENADGTITYNSRAFFKDQKRYLATSTDGGETFGDFRTDDFLLEEINIGCNASFLRVEKADLTDTSLLPEDADGITLFANPRSKVRDHMTVCYSFDGGKTWAGLKEIYAGPSGYSSLTFSAPEQRFYLVYERGINHYIDQGIAAAAFDLEWLLSSC